MDRRMQKAILITLCMLTLNTSAMDGMMAHTQSQLAEEKTDELKFFSIEVQNAEGASCISEQFDLNNHAASLHTWFKELIDTKHGKNTSYIFAQAVEKRGDVAVVECFDAHALIKMLFGGYPLEGLRDLSTYTSPVNGLPLGELVFYEYKPHERIEFLCSYAALYGKSEHVMEFWRHRFYANQDEDLGLAARANNRLGMMYYNGCGVAKDDAEAMRLYTLAANQTHDLSLALSARINLGVMYEEGQGVAVNYARAREFYEQAANQKYDLKVAAVATYNLGSMYANGFGVAVDYARAKELWQEVANQTHNLRAAGDAQRNLAVLEALMNKNG